MCIRDRENIILIGMPGVGKTTVGKALGEEMGRTCVDVDHELEKEIGDISTYITEQGEPAFRDVYKRHSSTLMKSWL